MKIRRGDVYWYDDGHGRRPVAVLTRDPAIPLLSRVVVAPASTTIRNAPTEVLLGPDDGMPSPCVLSLDNIRTVRKAHLKRRIATLSPARLDQICEGLAYTLDC